MEIISDEEEKVSPKPPDAVRKLIISYKKDNPDVGFRKIEQWLKKKYLQKT